MLSFFFPFKTFLWAKIATILPYGYSRNLYVYNLYKGTFQKKKNKAAGIYYYYWL